MNVKPCSNRSSRNGMD